MSPLSMIDADVEFEIALPRGAGGGGDALEIFSSARLTFRDAGHPPAILPSGVAVPGIGFRGGGSFGGVLVPIKTESPVSLEA